MSLRGPVAISGALLLALGLAACGAPEERRGGANLDVEIAGPAIAAGPSGLESYLDCLSAERVTLVAAHRGGPAPGYPENALATFAHVLSRAPVILEIDVQSTADGELVLMHDDRLEEGTDCAGPIADARWTEVSACRLRDPGGRVTEHRAPRLADALAWSEGRTILQLDIKRSVSYERLIDEIRLADAEERVILITYSPAAASRLARLAPDLVISAPVAELDDVIELRDRGVDPDELVAWTGTGEPDPALFDQLDARDVPVAFGALGGLDRTIASSGEEGRYRALAEEGVDILSTDRPVVAYEDLRDARDPAPAIQTCGRR